MQTHRALTVGDDPNQFIIKDKPVPVVGDDDILVRVIAVTLNPTDWKHAAFGWSKPGASVGSDFAGDVVQMGKNAEGKGIKVGDAVAGYRRGGVPDDKNGSFQEYVRTLPESAWVIPKDKLSYEEAAAMGGISLSTAVQSLFSPSCLNLSPPWRQVQKSAEISIPVLIWSGATSVGIYAIRLAKLAGLRVATTASEKNHALLKELGAEVVFDYCDPEAPRKIKEWSGGKIVQGIDTISEFGSTKLAAEAFSDEGGRLICLLPVPTEGLGNVEVEVTMIYTALNKDKPDDFTLMAEWNRVIPTYCDTEHVGKIMPLDRRSGGLEKINEGLADLREGKVKAQKISYVIATP